MADTVAPMITDSVTQDSVEVLANVPAVATANLMQSTAVALSAMVQNATANQQAAMTLLQAVTASSVAMLDRSTAGR